MGHNSPSKIEQLNIVEELAIIPPTPPPPTHTRSPKLLWIYPPHTRQPRLLHGSHAHSTTATPTPQSHAYSFLSLQYCEALGLMTQCPDTCVHVGVRVMNTARVHTLPFQIKSLTEILARVTHLTALTCTYLYVHLGFGQQMIQLLPQIFR